MIFENLAEKVISPAILSETEQFILKIAEDENEIKKAQRLRFEIFNIEQGKGLESAKSTGIDIDEFDDYCLHLLVIVKESGRAVGTYRVHLGSIANSAKGFYSAREYDIKGLDKITQISMELGRSCVSREYRTGAVVGLLWSGIAELLNRTGLKIMIGCVSLEEKKPAIAWALYRYLKNCNLVSEILEAKPKEQFLLPEPPEDEIQKQLANEKSLRRNIPPLFKGYLRIGCKICGGPAWDGEFGTVDFLIIVNKDEVPERYFRHFNPPAENE